MAFSKIIAESMDLTDTYAFTGTVTGAGGITESDNWRITSAQSISSATDTVVNSSWERNDVNFEKIGTGLTESSGVFSFPSTGKYLITANLTLYRSGDTRYAVCKIMTTINNSSFNEASYNYAHIKQISSATYESIATQTIFDVTDTTNCKFRINAQADEAITVGGDTNTTYTGFTCIKLGET